MTEKLCLFCQHFSWSKEEMWGMGSEYTGPMFEGGDASCGKGHDWPVSYPGDENDFRLIVIKAQTCADYLEVES